MAWPRRHSYYRPSHYSSSSKLTVSIVWDTLTNATYNVRFAYRGQEQWKIVEQIVSFIKKTIPSSQREWIPESKTWIVGESMIKPIVELCQAIPNVELNFIEKPVEQTFTSKFHSKEADFEEFKRLLSFAHINLDTSIEDTLAATKAYRKAAMILHPDKNPKMYQEMSSLNEIYTRLFKQSKQAEVSNV